MKKIFSAIVLATVVASGAAVASPDTEHNGQPVISAQSAGVLSKFVATDTSFSAGVTAGGKIFNGNDPARGGWTGK